MRSILLILPVLVCSARVSYCGEWIERTGRGNGDVEVDVSSLPKGAQERIAWLKVGMTRGEIVQYFKPDGGLFTFIRQRYFLKDLKIGDRVVMVEIEFQPEGMPDEVFADKDRVRKWGHDHAEELLKNAWNKGDIIRGVSKAYLSYEAFD